MKKYTILILFCLLPGCAAYLNYSRLYSIQPDFSQEKAQQTARVVADTLAQKGLTLSMKYHDTYPEDVAVTIFEIPRRPEEKRRHPLLIVLIKKGNQVQLKHSEWYLHFVSNKHRPSDFIREITPELVSVIKNEIGTDIEIVLTKEN